MSMLKFQCYKSCTAKQCKWRRCLIVDCRGAVTIKCTVVFTVKLIQRIGHRQLFSENFPLENSQQSLTSYEQYKIICAEDCLSNYNCTRFQHSLIVWHLVRLHRGVLSFQIIFGFFHTLSSKEASQKQHQTLI